MWAAFFVGLCGLLHLVFMFLEMYFCTRPAGLKIFRQTKAQADASKILAANQGLYNGVLAAGLFWSLTLPPEWANEAQTFFLLSVVAVGVYGAWTVNRRIFWIQAFPATMGLAALLAGR